MRLLLRNNTVVARWFRPVNRDQGCLLPADMRSWLPPDHLAWQVLEVTGELDLSKFAAAYRADGQGQAPYDPAMMLPLVLYCLFKGNRSSRKIRDACVDDLGCLVICGGARPSHRAVAEFLRRHRDEIRRLFVQVLGLLAAAGAVEGHSAAIDGSPVSGNASRFANLDAGQLAARIAALEAAVAAEAGAWLDGAGQADGADGRQPLPYDDDEDEDGGEDGGPRGGGLPRRLSALAARLARLRAGRRTPWPSGPPRPGRRGPGPAGPGRAAAGRRAGPGRRDGEVPGRGGRREGLGRQEAGPRREQRQDRRDPQEPGHRPGPAGRRPGPRRRGHPGQGVARRPGHPAAAGQERRLRAGLEPGAGRRPPPGPARRRAARQPRRCRRPDHHDRHRCRQLRAGRAPRPDPGLARR